MMRLNHVVVAGMLDDEPKLATSSHGAPRCALRLAVYGRTKHDDQWQQRIDHVDVLAYGRLAETCAETLSRGSRVVVDGQLSSSDRTARDGRSFTSLYVTAKVVESLADSGGFRDARGDEHVGRMEPTAAPAGPPRPLSTSRNAQNSDLRS